MIIITIIINARPATLQSSFLFIRIRRMTFDELFFERRTFEGQVDTLTVYDMGLSVMDVKVTKYNFHVFLQFIFSKN